MAEGITLALFHDHLSFMQKMYDVVRLVDPVNKVILDYQGDLTGSSKNRCFDCWERGASCDNCISIRAYQNNQCYQKLEQSPSAIMLVTALPIENIGRPVVLELVKNATHTMLLGDDERCAERSLSDIVTDLNGLAVQDDLTGLYNRRYINERLPADLLKSALSQTPLSLIFLDIDNMKRLNDGFGHAFGDHVLTSVAQVLSGCIRVKTDWAARYGGDEFVVCLNNTDSGAAHRVAERIRRRISELRLSPAEAVPISASLGIITTSGNDVTADEIIAHADMRMYEAKRGGKNCSISDEQPYCPRYNDDTSAPDHT